MAGSKQTCGERPGRRRTACEGEGDGRPAPASNGVFDCSLLWPALGPKHRRILVLLLCTTRMAQQEHAVVPAGAPPLHALLLLTRAWKACKRKLSFESSGISPDRHLLDVPSGRGTERESSNMGAEQSTPSDSPAANEPAAAFEALPTGSADQANLEPVEGNEISAADDFSNVTTNSDLSSDMIVVDDDGCVNLASAPLFSKGFFSKQRDGQNAVGSTIDDADSGSSADLAQAIIMRPAAPVTHTVTISKPAPTTMIGVHLNGRDGPPLVVSVAPDGAAFGAVFAGDVLLSVNGATANGREQGAAMLKSASGQLTLLVRRKSATDVALAHDKRDEPPAGAPPSSPVHEPQLSAPALEPPPSEPALERAFEDFKPTTGREGAASLHCALLQPKQLASVLAAPPPTSDPNLFSPNRRDEDGDRCPLHWAAARGSIECVQLLLDAGAHLGATDSKGNTAAGLAMQLNQRAVHAMLTKAIGDAQTDRQLAA